MVRGTTPVSRSIDMAEIYLDYYNRRHKKKLRKRDVRLACDLCEFCGKWTKTIVFIKSR